MKSLTGKLLVATRELVDPNFLQTVVLLVQHNDEGALGVVLNRPTPVKLAAVWAKLGSGLCRQDDFLYRGGPCEGPLMALHDQREHADQEVLPGLFYSAERKSIAQVVADASAKVRVFAGYAGWQSGQLEDELTEHSWWIADATFDGVFHDPSEQWVAASKQALGTSLLTWLKIRTAPEDLRRN